MADRSVVVRLRADISDYQRRMSEAARGARDAAQGAGDFIDRNSQAIGTLTTGMGLVGAGMTGVAAVAVSKFADFDQAMSNVRAATGETTGNMALLRQAALDFGASTVYSATEAAGAIENLAKAGISTEAILGGGLKGALDLAAAGQLNVADAAEFAASAMTQFKLNGEDVPHIADLLAAAAGKAQGDVSDMGQALNQAGLVANQTGLTIEEATGTLAAFASAGLLGSDAGTSFKTMLQRLSAPTADVQGLMDELGISAYDASGEFVGMAEFAGQLTTALGGMTPAARNAAMATIFGSDAVRAAAVVYDNGATGIQSWIDKVDDSGYAAEQAAMRLDNLKGDWEAFTGALDTALIGMGEGANGPLRALVQQATDAVDAFDNLPPGVQQATLALVGGGGLVLLGVAGMGKLVVSINEAKTALTAMGITAKSASLAAGGVGAALAIAAVGLTTWAQNAAEAKARTEELQGTLDRFGKTTDETIKSINSFLSSDQSNWLDGLFGKDPRSLIDMAKKYGLAIEDLQGYILGQADAIDRVATATDDYLDGFDRTGREYENKKSGIDQFIGALDGEKQALGNSMTAAEQKAAADKVAGVATDEFAASISAANVEVKSQAELLTEVAEAHTTLMGIVLGERDAQRGFEQALDSASEALEKNGKTLDITTEKGRANQAALDGIASSGAKLVEQMAANGASQEEIQAAVQRTRDEFIRMAGAMGVGAQDAEALANKLGLIPGDYAARVVADTNPARAAIDEFLRVARSQQVVIQARVNADPNYSPARAPSMIARAEGGPVVGPGSETSDSIHALLSNGEHVWTAAEVRAAGGHGAVMTLRTAALSGRPRFAAGGPVGEARSVAYIPTAQAPVGAPAVDLTGLQLVGTLDLGGGLEGRMEAVAVGVVDARDRSSGGTRQTRGWS
ncbi:phage tail tape measure protein [Oerskovia turbata]